MSDEVLDQPSGLSRRDLLKRGGLVGAAAVWTVPIVQAVSMTPAHADTPSAPGGGGNNPPPVTDVPTTPAPSQSNSPSGGPTDPSSPVASPTSSTVASSPNPSPSSSAAVDAAAATRIDKNKNGTSHNAAGTGALADTGVTVPVLPTVIAGAAAVALGAGVVAASKPRAQEAEASDE